MAKPRRGRGEGSVEKTSSGKYRVIYYVDGVKQPTKSFPTKKEALDWQHANRGKPAAVGTVGEWLSTWLTLQQSATAHQTSERDRQVIETHLRPKWGSAKLRDLELLAVRRWMAELETAGVSASERQRIGSTFKKILNGAVDSQVLASNPIARLKLPTVHREEKRVLTAAQLGHLAWCAAEEKHPQCRAMVLVQADACLRPGELLGLTRGDFDATAGTLRVRQSVEKRTGKIKALKNRHSRRTLPLARATIEAVVESLRGNDPAAPLFPRKFGNNDHLHYGNWRMNVFNPLRTQSGFDWLLPTTLRHTGASLLLSAGVNVLVVSRRCGHSSPVVTLTTYSHLMPDDQAKAAAAFDALLIPRNVPRR